MCKSHRISVALVSTVLIFLGGSARAATTRLWNVFDGNWSTAGNWSPSGVPAAGDTVNIFDTDGVSRTITYDYTGAAVTLGSLAIDLTNGTSDDTETLMMSANNLTAGFEYVGFSGAGSNGSGTFNQSGGVNTITVTSLYLGLNATDTGYYNLSGTGSLVNSGSSGEIVGYSGTGYFTQSGGSNSITASGSGLYLGYNANSIGSYTLNSGSLSMGPVGVNANQFIGYGAGSSGTFIQNGGTNTVVNAGSSLYIAYGSYSTGGYTLAGGNLNSGTEYVGFAGVGTFTQTGGTNTTNAAGGISIGHTAGSTGYYTMTGGTLSSAAPEVVGNQGNGTFDQSGGLNTTSAGVDPIYIGYSATAGAVGTYYLSGTGALSPGGIEYVGYGSEGDFYHSGGTNTLTSSLYLGYSNGVTGTYTLSATGVVIAHADEIIGQGGVGIFTQTGGVNTLAGASSIDLGRSIGSIGTYNVFGGVTTVGGNVNVGFASGLAPGVLNVDGGTLNVGGTIIASNVVGSAINLSSGTINTAALNLNNNPAALTWTGGTLDITTNLTLDSLAAGTTTGGAFGPSLTLTNGQTLMVTGNENIGGSGFFMLTIQSGAAHVVTGTLTLPSTGVIEQDDGSTLYAATFLQAGGTVIGTLQNQGTFTYQSGLFSGRLLNQGTVNLGLNFTAGDGVENDTSMTLATGQILTANGDGINNLGSFLLTGGTVAGDGSFVNNYGGTLQGHGAVNSYVYNYGTVAVSGVLAFNGGLLNDGLIQGSGTLSGGLTNAIDGTVDLASGESLAITTAWTNAGLIALEGSTARISGGGITNTGAIQGHGLISSPIDNSGTIEALGGTLSLGGAVQNEAMGLLTAGNGSKLLVTAGLATNAGVINLTGGTFDNNGQPLNNMGEISGWGLMRTGGTGLDNNGSITFTGGTTTVNGPVTNESGQTITVAYNPAIFTGLVTNNSGATFTTTSATATFAGGFTNNGATNFVNTAGGMVNVIAAPTALNSGSALSIASGTLSFDLLAGSPVVGSGVSIQVNSGTTLQLAGTVSALSDTTNPTTNLANVVTHGSGALLVTGTNQTVGTVTGDASSNVDDATVYTGSTVVGNGSGAAQLTATQILQNTLTINAGSTVTIAPSGAGMSAVAAIDSAPTSGAPIVSGQALAAGSPSSSTDSSDPFVVIQAAIQSGAISSAAGERLANRLAAIERLAASDPGIDLNLLESRILAAIPSSSDLPSTDSSSIGETGSDLLAADGGEFAASSGGATAAFAPAAGVAGSPTPVPEPSSLLLAAVAGIGLCVARMLNSGESSYRAAPIRS